MIINMVIVRRVMWVCEEEEEEEKRRKHNDDDDCYDLGSEMSHEKTRHFARKPNQTKPVHAYIKKNNNNNKHCLLRPPFYERVRGHYTLSPLMLCGE